MISEIETINRFEKREVRAAGQPRQSRLLTMGDLLSRQQGQEIAVRPPFLLGAINQAAPHAAGIRQMQPFEERVEVGIGGDHDRPPRGSGAAGCVGGWSSKGSEGTDVPR